MSQVTTPFKALTIGTRFVLLKKPAHGSIVLEKIEPIPFLNREGNPTEGLFWTAKWTDGPQKDKLCVVPHGADKDPIQVIALP